MSTAPPAAEPLIDALAGPGIGQTVHLSLLGLLLTYVARKASSESMQEALKSSAAGPLAMLVSFVLLDRIISRSAAECPGPETADTSHVIAVSTFSTLIIVSLCNLLLSSSSHRQLNVAFSLVTHTMIVLTYSQLHTGHGSGAVVWRTWYGSYLWPARVNLWMHSSMSQVLTFAATPRASDAWGTSFIMYRVRDVYLMFILGLFALRESPEALPVGAHLPVRVAALALSCALLLRILIFMHRALPQCLHVPELATGEGEGGEWLRGTSMRLLGHLIILSWLGFPAVFSVAALGLMPPDVEAQINSAIDIFAKVSATLALQYGQLASSVWEERTQQESILQASHSMVQGFKMFTQCIGHDLRTPLQALLFSKFKAVDIVEELIDSDSGGSVGGGGGGRKPRDTTAWRATDVDATPSTDTALGGAAAAPASAAATTAPKPAATEDEAAQAAAQAAAQRRRQAELRKVLSKLHEVGACAELLSCIVANIWDFEKLADASLHGQEAAAVNDETESEVNINESLAQLLEMLRSSPIYKRDVLLRSICDELIPPSLWGPRTVLLRGMLNLISNAMKFTHAGHISVHTSMLSSHQPSGDSASVRVRVEVIDTGRGMSEKEMQDARRPYVQGKSNGRVSGLGLGLPIVIASIERAGGKFDMSSTRDVGTRCSFELTFQTSFSFDPTLAPNPPDAGSSSANGASLSESIASSPASAAATDRREGRSGGRARGEGGRGGKHGGHHRSAPHGKKVLVVDDVEMIREGAAEMLRGYGHTVYTADDGQQGLETLKRLSDDLDIALIDIQMPVLCGDEVIAIFRAWELETRPSKRLRVYACTGNATSNDATAYLAAGFDGCVSKPIYPHVFRAILSDNKARIESALVNGKAHRCQGWSSSNASSATATPDSSHGSSPSSPLVPQPRTPHARSACSTPKATPKAARGDGRSGESCAVLWGASSRSGGAANPAAAAAPAPAPVPSEQPMATAATASATATSASATATSAAATAAAEAAAEAAAAAGSSAVASSADDPSAEAAADGDADRLEPLRSSKGAASSGPRLTHARIASVAQSPRQGTAVGGMDTLHEGGSSVSASSIGSPIVANASSNPAGGAAGGERQGSWTDGESSPPPSEGVLLAAARQREQLPKEVLDASFMVENIGHTTQQAAAFLARFRGYAAQQAELVRVAVETGAWAPCTTSSSGSIGRDRSQKTVRSLVHATKGAASMIGAHRFSAASRALQDASEALGDDAKPSVAERDNALGALEVWKSELTQLLQLLESEDADALSASRTPFFAAVA